jgi:diguanylate cyclase (GGDEF)-like protein
MGRRRVPPRAVGLSVVALSLPAAATLAYPEQLAHEVLVWLVALTPAFIISYYRGWSGVTKAVALGMAVLALVQLTIRLQGRQIAHWEVLATVVGAYVVVGLAVGILSELIHRERERALTMALTDGLTGLPNRRFAEIMLDREFGAAARGRRICVVMFDLDDFKGFNDRHGHAAGDEALQWFAEVLARHTRAMNLSARWGGEEFLSILSSSGLEGARVFVERVLEDLGELNVRGDRLSACAGLAEYGPSFGSTREFLEAADAALYHAKSMGSGTIAVVDGGASTSAERDAVTEASTTDADGRVA